MSIDPGALLGFTIIAIILTFLFGIFRFDLISIILTIVDVVCVIILLLQASERWDQLQPLRDSEAAYATYVEEVLKSYGYTDISIEYDLFSWPSGLDTGYSPSISATGAGDPNYTEMCNMLEVLNSYTDEDNGYLFDTDAVYLTFNGEKGKYTYFGTECYYNILTTIIVFDEYTKEWIPKIPIRGMGESQVYNTLIGEPTYIEKTDEGTSYKWVTGKRDNYEAIATDGHISCVRVMDTWRGDLVYAEDTSDNK